MPDNLILDLERNIGRTVTIFTESGGLSGSGFTGVLAAVGPNVVRLITSIGAAPACPVGSSCTGVCQNGYGFPGYGAGFGFGGNLLGSVCEIPICRIACFTQISL